MYYINGKVSQPIQTFYRFKVISSRLSLDERLVVFILVSYRYMHETSLQYMTKVKKRIKILGKFSQH